MQKRFGSILSFNIYVENINTIYSTTERIFSCGNATMWRKKAKEKKPSKNQNH